MSYPQAFKHKGHRGHRAIPSPVFLCARCGEYGLPAARQPFAYLGCCFFLNSPMTLLIGFCCCCCC